MASIVTLSWMSWPDFWTQHDFVSASSHYSFESSFQWQFRKFRSYDFAKVSFRELSKRPFLAIPRIQQLEKILLVAFSIDFIKPSTLTTGCNDRHNVVHRGQQNCLYKISRISRVISPMATGPCLFNVSWTTQHDCVHKHVDSLRCVPVLTFDKDFPDNLCIRNKTQVWFCYEVALASTIRIAQPGNTVLVYQCQQNITCQNILYQCGQHCDIVMNESTRFWTQHDFVSASSHYSFKLSFQWWFRKFRCSGPDAEARRKDELLSPCETVKLRCWNGVERFIEINEWTSSVTMKWNNCK